MSIGIGWRRVNSVMYKHESGAIIKRKVLTLGKFFVLMLDGKNVIHIAKTPRDCIVAMEVSNYNLMIGKYPYYYYTGKWDLQLIAYYGFKKVGNRELVNERKRMTVKHSTSNGKSTYIISTGNHFNSNVKIDRVQGKANLIDYMAERYEYEDIDLIGLEGANNGNK